MTTSEPTPEPDHVIPAPVIEATADATPAVNWGREFGGLAVVLFASVWVIIGLWLISNNAQSAVGTYVDGPAAVLTPQTSDNASFPGAAATWVVSRPTVTARLTPTTTSAVDREANP